MDTKGDLPPAQEGIRPHPNSLRTYFICLRLSSKENARVCGFLDNLEVMYIVVSPSVRLPLNSPLDTLQVTVQSPAIIQAGVIEPRLDI